MEKKKHWWVLIFVVVLIVVLYFIISLSGKSVQLQTKNEVIINAKCPIMLITTAVNTSVHETCEGAQIQARAWANSQCIDNLPSCSTTNCPTETLKFSQANATECFEINGKQYSTAMAKCQVNCTA